MAPRVPSLPLKRAHIPHLEHLGEVFSLFCEQYEVDCRYGKNVEKHGGNEERGIRSFAEADKET